MMVDDSFSLICSSVCRDDSAGGAAVWSAPPGALWGGGGEGGNSPAEERSAEPPHHRPRDRDPSGPGTVTVFTNFHKTLIVSDISHDSKR